MACRGRGSSRSRLHKCRTWKSLLSRQERVLDSVQLVQVYTNDYLYRRTRTLHTSTSETTETSSMPGHVYPSLSTRVCPQKAQNNAAIMIHNICIQTLRDVSNVYRRTRTLYNLTSEKLEVTLRLSWRDYTRNESTRHHTQQGPTAEQ